MFTTPSQVSFHYHLSPFSTSSHPPFPSGNHHTVFCVCEGFFFLVPAPFFTQLCNPSDRTRIAGRKAVSLLIFLKELHTVFYSNCTNLHSHQQCKRVSLCPHPYRHLLFVDLLKTAILTGVRCCLIIVLICIYLMINNFVHLFTCLLAIYMSSLEKCIFRSFAQF